MTGTDGMKTVAIIGVGYVGLPLAVAMSAHHRVLGFDRSSLIVEQLQQGVLPPNLSAYNFDLLKIPNLEFTADASQLQASDTIIICVPTPIHADHTPDFSALDDACLVAGSHMKKGVTVIFESTVAPGTTEKRCIPLLEKASGMQWKKDFFVGYSPERINPADTKHTLATVTKLIAGDTPETITHLRALYGPICTLHAVSQIRVAEASKILENTQRDVNIALMNEMALLYKKLGISTKEVIEAAGTKWNFASFMPGLVGGHCIGVDPYYLIEEAAEHGFSTDLLVTARKRNEGLAKYLAGVAIFHLPDNAPREAVILGISYKANAADIRNSKALELAQLLQDAGVTTHLHDPHAYHERLVNWDALPACPLLILTVAHSHYGELSLAQIMEKVTPGGMIIDLPSMLNPAEFEGSPITLWQL